MWQAHGTDDSWLQLRSLAQPPCWEPRAAWSSQANVTMAKTQLGWQQLQLVRSLGGVSQSRETLHISALRLQPAEPPSLLQALFPCCFSPEK